MGADGSEEHQPNLAQRAQRGQMQNQQEISSYWRQEASGDHPPKTSGQNRPKGQSPKGHQGSE
eukprot:11704329-Karenia_brevis.AAC.1